MVISLGNWLGGLGRSATANRPNGPSIPKHDKPMLMGGSIKEARTMTERLQWHPTPEEVADIVAELRPMIEAMAHRQTRELAALHP